MYSFKIKNSYYCLLLVGPPKIYLYIFRFIGIFANATFNMSILRGTGGKMFIFPQLPSCVFPLRLGVDLRQLKPSTSHSRKGKVETFR